jgi:hypothetical protein
MTRPYISERGELRRGIIALPSRYTERVMMSSVWERILRSSAIASRAGATVAEDIELKRLNRDIGMKTIHFRLAGQFFGFSGSLGPSHVTYPRLLLDVRIVPRIKEFCCHEGRLTRFGSGAGLPDEEEEAPTG